ncbi:MAG: aminotransferase class I/II-fold pyridoxal phosphate-dependent enzyme [Treponema sp.]|jgi:aspartate/methionine/tyrosine aminotransferase|nr:aminotransferase class I/II-fold pyridoxal phosphate-dependent enzyme [Treponema sp.]
MVTVMNPLAEELNSVLDTSPAGPLLSALGRRLFFPRGIIAQAAEAKKTAGVNATLGMAFHRGKPLMLSGLARQFPGLEPEEVVVYAPTAGVEGFRRAWKKSLLRKNPSLKEGDFTLPVTAPGITAGISYMADLFLDEGQVMLAGDPSWDNYGLIFAERRGALLKGIPLFQGGGLNIGAFEKALREEAASGTVRIILNFPHNPSGYTPTRAEADALTGLIGETAAGGSRVLVLCDDAYFGLFYEEETVTESLFSRFAALHERILAVKIDGPTKEDYVWGLRTAFISFGSKGLNEETAGALEKKLMGAIRSSVSCANTPAQFLTAKILEDPAAAGEKAAFFALLRDRYRAVKRFIAEHSCPSLEPLPFNSGYFMSFRCKEGPSGRVDAEKLRQGLLKKGIGTIALGSEYLRVTFAAVEEEDIPEIYQAIYDTAAELA